MKKTSNITVIIPVHEFNENVSNYLSKSLESIKNQKDIESDIETIIVCPDNISAEIESVSLLLTGVRILVNDGKTDYQSQVNLAANHVNTDYFMILEFDDEIGVRYFLNSEKYVSSYPDVEILLSMMIEINSNNQGIKLTNESVWSQQFVGENGEMGFLNLNILKQYSDFKLSGAVIKKKDFISIGGFKVNIQLAFGYEFLLRALNNGLKVFTMAKVGYKHLADRSGSLFDNYLKNMPVNERKFWFETAVKEANFNADRNINTSKINVISE